MEIFRHNTLFDTLFTVALYTRSHLLATVGNPQMAVAEFRKRKTVSSLIGYTSIKPSSIGCRMQQKESELESVQARLWLACASARHDGDKEVDGSAGVSKYLAGSGRVYSGSCSMMKISRDFTWKYSVYYTNSEFISACVKDFTLSVMRDVRISKR